MARRSLRRLSAYLLAEEQCLYPALFATLGSATPLEPLTDHLKLKRMVAELLRMDALEASFSACVFKLQGRLRSYGVRQRHSLFPLMQAVFSPGELELIGGETQLFLATNRRVTGGSGASGKALLEAVRDLLASSAQASRTPAR